MKKHFVEKGWVVIDFEDKQAIFDIKTSLEHKLSELLGEQTSLEAYNPQDDEKHSAIQVKMTEHYREQRFGIETIHREASFFQDLVGIDLVAQNNPYLRIARPHKKQDNIGYHRDTFYGGSPYEISVLIPFVDVPKESALGVISGSHIASEEAYPTQQLTSNITKGSPKHQIGFMYAPKQMEDSVGDSIEPIPLKIGQALAFCLPIVHGCCINLGQTTRWSSDIRIMNAYAPVVMGTRTPQYEVIGRSPITICANQYKEANGDNRREAFEMEMCLRGD